MRARLRRQQAAEVRLAKPEKVVLVGAAVRVVAAAFPAQVAPVAKADAVVSLECPALAPVVQVTSRDVAGSPVQAAKAARPRRAVQATSRDVAGSPVQAAKAALVLVAASQASLGAASPVEVVLVSPAVQAFQAADSRVVKAVRVAQVVRAHRKRASV